MKIVTTKTHRQGKTVSYGTFAVAFDSECSAEVTQEEAKLMMEQDDSIIDENAPKVAEKEIEEVETSIASMSVKELKSIAQEAGLPEDEWKDLKKAELVAYIESKQ